MKTLLSASLIAIALPTAAFADHHNEKAAPADKKGAAKKAAAHDCGNLPADVAAIENSVAELRKLVDSKKVELEKAHKEHHDLIDSQAAKIKETAAKLAACDKAVAAAKTKNGELGRKLADAEKLQAATAKKLADLTKTHTDATTKFAALTKTHGATTTKLTALEKSHADSTKKFTTQLKTAGEAMASLTKKFESSQQESTKALAAAGEKSKGEAALIAKLRAENATLKKNCHEGHTALIALREQVAALRADITGEAAKPAAKPEQKQQGRKPAEKKAPAKAEKKDA